MIASRTRFEAVDRGQGPHVSLKCSGVHPADSGKVVSFRQKPPLRSFLERAMSRPDATDSWRFDNTSEADFKKIAEICRVASTLGFVAQRYTPQQQTGLRVVHGASDRDQFVGEFVAEAYAE